MTDQKLENLLNLSLDATEEERIKSLELNVGYETADNRWDVIIRSSRDLSEIEEFRDTYVALLGGYGILRLSREQIQRLSRYPYVEFVEKPKRLFFSVVQGKSASCVSAVRDAPYSLTGRGVLVGMVDSGIDVNHPEFTGADGESRILELWDQSIPGNPPEGYRMGTIYTREQIREGIPSVDSSGHGTAVMSIAAGRQGVAPESEILAVKLGVSADNSFPRTTELMQGVDYLVRRAVQLEKPIAINVSFGNNYGSHQGLSLMEAYLDAAAGTGKTTICVGMGNEGTSALHTSGQLGSQEKRVQFSVGAYESAVNLQLWKNYVDSFEIYLIHPNGTQIGPLSERLGPQRYLAGATQLLIYYGEPNPYSVLQEIYMDFLPLREYVDDGIWTLRMVPRRVIRGEYELWLPGGGVLNQGTVFLTPTPFGSLTIPSSSRKVIAVGAYDSWRESYASFSGRGLEGQQKPDLVAPGVRIRAASPAGGYSIVTGTSFATPFVTGAAALLNQWGVVEQNDSFLYGEKVKAYLRRGARQLPGFDSWPNELLGWGALCLRNSLPM